MTTNSLNNECLNDFTVTSATSGDTSTLTVENTNSGTSSDAANIVSVNNSSTSDLYTRYAVGTTAQYAVGIDNSDSDQFKISYAASSATPSSTNYFVSDSSGNITHPNKPMFSVWLDTLSASVTGDGTVYTIVFDTEYFDIGSNFNTGTGVFTAPVAGKYFFGAIILSYNLAADTYDNAYAAIAVNGSQVCQNKIGASSAVYNGFDMITLESHIYISLAASDTVTVQVMVDNAGKDVGIGDVAAETVWSGFLIG